MAHKGRIMTVLFCGFLAGLLVWHIALPDRARSETENRTLAQRPSLSRETLLNGSFTAGMETYFADQFPLRDDWTGLKARCELLLGKREFNGVYLCGDTLIAKVEEPEAAQATVFALRLGIPKAFFQQFAGIAVTLHGAGDPQWRSCATILRLTACSQQ